MSEFNLKKYISNNPLITEGLKVGDRITYDKTGEEFEVAKVSTDKLIIGRDRQGEQKVLSVAHISKIDESINEKEELTFIPSSGTKAGGTFELNNRKYELTSPVKNVTIGGRYVTDLPKGTILYNLAGGLLADHESLRKFESPSSQYFDKSNYSGIMIRKDKEVLNNIINNSKVLEFYED